jgi:hypothetical protein
MANEIVGFGGLNLTVSYAHFIQGSRVQFPSNQFGLI